MKLLGALHSLTQAKTQHLIGTFLQQALQPSAHMLKRKQQRCSPKVHCKCQHALMPLQNGLAERVERSRKQIKERKNRSKKIRGVKKNAGQYCHVLLCCTLEQTQADSRFSCALTVYGVLQCAGAVAAFTHVASPLLGQPAMLTK